MADAGVDLVANQHPCRRNIVVLQDPHRVVDIIGHGSEHLAVRHACPGRRWVLMAYVVPCIPKLETDSHLKPGILAAYGHSSGLSNAAMPTHRITRWINPGT